MPQPIVHAVQCANTEVLSPRAGVGIQGQFWVQMALSSSSFQGTGVKMMPTAEPPASFSRSLREKFMIVS
jgi:hypothetical protein